MSQPPFLPGKFYHLYNRGNNGENIFKEKKNYRYFLKKYWKYIPAIADTFSYCLLRNHFHFLIRIKNLEDLFNYRYGRSLSAYLGQKFATCFGAYTKAINIQAGRSGSLFEKPVNRKIISGDDDLRRLILYIHFNPVHHGFVNEFMAWPYSSYHQLTADSRTLLDRNFVLDIFGGLGGFIAAHKYDPSRSNFSVSVHNKLPDFSDTPKSIPL